MDPISAELWELVDEEHEASGEEDSVGYEVSGEAWKKVTRIEESED